MTEGFYKVDVDDIMNQTVGTYDNKEKFDNLINQRISRFDAGNEAKYKFNIK